MNPNNQYPNPNQPNPNYNPNMQNQQYPPNYQGQPMPMGHNQMMPQQGMQNPNMPPQMNMNYQNNQVQPLNGPPMQGNPQYVNQMMQNQQFSNRPFIPHKEKIMMTQGIFVKQKMSLLEVVSGCERQNKYEVYLKKDGKVKKKGKPLWKAKEKSGCCSRNCLDNQCRPMKIKISNCSQLDEDPQCILMEKECSCTCLCFNRPVIDVYYTEDQNSGKQRLGQIKDNFDCCNFTFNVYDHQGQKVFRIFTTCCQCAIWCGGCPCSPCEKVNFQVFDTSGKVLLEIKKKNKDCLKSAFSDADNFGVDYPSNMGWEHRTLLMCTILFIDYMMFEEKGGMADNSQTF